MSNVSSAEIPVKLDEIRVNFQRNPVFIYAGHISSEQNRHIPRHKHDAYSEVIFIESGKAIFYIDNKKYIANEGDIVIFNRGMYHEEFYSSDNCFETYYCAMGNVFIEGFKELWITPSYIEPVLNSLSYRDRIKSLLSELHNESCTRSTGYNHICNNLLENLIVLVVRIINEQFSILKPSSNVNLNLLITKKMMEYIDSNYSHNITLEDVAKELHINLYYLSHIFKKETGSTPKKYLINRRIDEAKRLLLTTEMSIREIANYVGYENPNHFYLPFKKSTGYTPEEYRKELKNSIIKF